MLLSSHLLHEVEAVADQLVIIGNGKIVAAGTREELLAGAGTLVARGDHGDDRLRPALADAASTAARAPTAASSSRPSPTHVGRAALAGGVALEPPRAVRERGLKQLFFDLTSAPAGHAQRRAAADLQETAR